MEPKEKAKKLVDKFYQLFPLNKDVNTTDGKLHWEYNDWEQSKQCAMIAVDEILNSIATKKYLVEIGEWIETAENNYWQEMKKEIEKL